MIKEINFKLIFFIAALVIIVCSFLTYQKFDSKGIVKDKEELRIKMVIYETAWRTGANWGHYKKKSIKEKFQFKADSLEMVEYLKEIQ